MALGPTEPCPEREAAVGGGQGAEEAPTLPPTFFSVSADTAVLSN